MMHNQRIECRIRILMMLFLPVLFQGCKKEKSSSLIGSYCRVIPIGGGVYSGIRLTFNDNNVLKWEPVDSIPGHTSSIINYSLNGSEIRLYGDSDCGSEAYYTYMLTGNNLLINVKTDDCSPRQLAMTGSWTRR